MPSFEADFVGSLETIWVLLDWAGLSWSILGETIGPYTQVVLYLCETEPGPEEIERIKAVLDSVDGPIMSGIVWGHYPLPTGRKPNTVSGPIFYP